MDLDLRKKLVEYCIWRRVELGAETWTLRRDQKNFESSEMWCWRRVDKINWTHRVKNEEVLQRVKKERNILHNLQYKEGRFNLIVHILRTNCLLKHVTENTKGWRRGGRTCKQLLEDHKEMRTYWGNRKRKHQIAQ